MTRAEKLGESGQVTISLPKQHFDYLTHLAKVSRLGITRDEVATHILIRDLDDKMEGGYPKVRMAGSGEPIPTRRE